MTTLDAAGSTAPSASWSAQPAATHGGSLGKRAEEALADVIAALSQKRGEMTSPH